MRGLNNFQIITFPLLDYYITFLLVGSPDFFVCVFRPGTNCQQPWSAAPASEEEDYCDDNG